MNAASYSDLRNAQPPLFPLSTGLRHIFVFTWGTMGGRPAFLLSTCVSAQEDLLKEPSHDVLTPPRCITPAVRSLTTIGRKEAGCCSGRGKSGGKPNGKLSAVANSSLTARVSPHFALRTGPFLEMQLRTRMVGSSVRTWVPETAVDASHTGVASSAVYLRCSPHFRYRWQETTIIRRLFPVGSIASGRHKTRRGKRG